MQLIIHPKAVEQLKIDLAAKLERGMDYAVTHAQEVVPIDTGRLQSTIRSTKPEITKTAIRSAIIAGGLSVKGVFKETTFSRDVDYGLATEIRYAWLRQNLIPMSDLIVEGLKQS